MMFGQDPRPSPSATSSALWKPSRCRQRCRAVSLHSRRTLLRPYEALAGLGPKRSRADPAPPTPEQPCLPRVTFSEIQFRGPGLKANTGRVDPSRRNSKWPQQMHFHRPARQHRKSNRSIGRQEEGFSFPLFVSFLFLSVLFAAFEKRDDATSPI